MEVRFLHGERVETIRRAIAVSQLVPQADETLVGYWLACYTRPPEGADTGQHGAAQRKGRKKSGAQSAAVAAG